MRAEFYKRFSAVKKQKSSQKIHLKVIDETISSCYILIGLRMTKGHIYLRFRSIKLN